MNRRGGKDRTMRDSARNWKVLSFEVLEFSQRQIGSKQGEGEPVKPLEANLSKRMECEMVSKAVVRSRRMNRLSFVILTNPTSVLCKRQNWDF